MAMKADLADAGVCLTLESPPLSVVIIMALLIGAAPMRVMVLLTGAAPMRGRSAAGVQPW